MYINNFLYFLDVNDTQLCNDLKPVFRIIGIIILLLKIAAPIVLLLIGMIEAVKTISSKDEESIRKVWKTLGKRALAAVIVFLIGTMIGIIMSLINSNEYQCASECINKPFSCSKITKLPDIGSNSKIEVIK